MSLVKSIDHIDQNARYLLEVAFGNLADKGEARSLIARGSVFYPIEYQGVLAFVPSRFLGYRDNSIEKHNEAKSLKERDGTQTNPAIHAILGPHRADDTLEERWVEFCGLLDVEPKGRFPKKFWRIETAKSFAAPTGSAINDIHSNENGNDDPEYKKRMAGSYVRDSKVRDVVLARAAGKCEFGSDSKNGQICRTFLRHNGSAYLEAHHVIKLSEQGRDKETNVIALCATHHREAHFGRDWKRMQDEFLRIIAEKAGK